MRISDWSSDVCSSDLMSGQGDQLEQLQAQIDALKSENSNMASEGTRVLSAYDDENRSLKEQLAAAQSGPRPGAGPTALYGPGGPAAYDSVAGAAADADQSRRVQIGRAHV